jgi:hypothetical protein
MPAIPSERTLRANLRLTDGALDQVIFEFWAIGELMTVFAIDP